MVGGPSSWQGSPDASSPLTIVTPSQQGCRAVDIGRRSACARGLRRRAVARRGTAVAMVNTMDRWEPHCSSGASVIELDAFRARPPMRRWRRASGPTARRWSRYRPPPRGGGAVRLEWRPWLALGVWMSSCLIVYVAAMINIVYGASRPPSRDQHAIPAVPLLPPRTVARAVVAKVRIAERIVVSRIVRIEAQEALTVAQTTVHHATVTVVRSRRSSPVPNSA